MRKLILLMCLMLLAGLPGAAPRPATGVISGWVRVASEDNQGKILSVEIVVGEAPAEEPYLVVGKKGTELQNLVGEWVVASGLVTEDSLGWKSINVVQYTKIDELKQPTEAPPGF